MMAAESASAASCGSAACWSTPPRALVVGAGGANVLGLPVIGGCGRVGGRFAGDGRPCDGRDAFGEGRAVGLYQTHGNGQAGLVGLVVFLHYERLGEGRCHYLLALTEDVDFLSTAMPLGSRIA